MNRLLVVCLVLSIGVVAPAMRAQSCPVGTNASLSFDGNDYADFGNPAAITGLGASDFSVEAWIRTPSNNARRQILTFGGVGTNSGAWFFVNSFGQLQFDRSAIVGPNSSAVVADNQWHHVAVVRSGTTLTLYVDGAVDGQQTGATGFAVASGTVVLGRGLPGGPGFFGFEGNIDEVRVWNVARSGAQLLANASFVLPPSTVGLVAYWRMNELSGQSIADASVSGITGTRGASASAGVDDPTQDAVNVAPLCSPGAAIGQANSANARLEINGQGTGTSPGPFPVVVATGATLTLAWAGQANQHVVLLTGPLNAGALNYPGLGTIDLGTPPTFTDVSILFDGGQPPFDFFFTLTPAGVTSQSFVVPSLPPGTLLDVQGLVYAPGTTFGIVLTAAFRIAVI